MYKKDQMAVDKFSKIQISQWLGTQMLQICDTGKLLPLVFSLAVLA
jgi:hypothetical protein